MQRAMYQKKIWNVREIDGDRIWLENPDNSIETILTDTENITIIDEEGDGENGKQ